MISLTQKPLPDITQHSQETDVHAPGGIRTHNSNKRAATDPHIRPRGHWDRPHNHAEYRGADKSLARPTSPCIFLMVRTFLLMLVLFYIYIQGVTGGMCETSGECSLGQTIPI
jgi:hypothetical protein